MNSKSRYSTSPTVESGISHDVPLTHLDVTVSTLFVLQVRPFLKTKL